MAKQKTTRAQGVTAAGRVLDVTGKTLRHWLKCGCPGTLTSAGWRVDPAEVKTWLAATGRTGKPGRPVTGGGPELDLARLRKEAAMAENWELRNTDLRASLIDAVAVQAGDLERVAIVNRHLLAIGAEIAQRLVERTASEIQGMIDHHVRRVCETIANE